VGRSVAGRRAQEKQNARIMTSGRPSVKAAAVQEPDGRDLAFSGAASGAGSSRCFRNTETCPGPETLPGGRRRRNRRRAAQSEREITSFMISFVPP